MSLVKDRGCIIKDGALKANTVCVTWIGSGPDSKGEGAVTKSKAEINWISISTQRRSQHGFIVQYKKVKEFLACTLSHFGAGCLQEEQRSGCVNESQKDGKLHRNQAVMGREGEFFTLGQ